MRTGKRIGIVLATLVIIGLVLTEGVWALDVTTNGNTTVSDSAIKTQSASLVPLTNVPNLPGLITISGGMANWKTFSSYASNLMFDYSSISTWISSSTAPNSEYISLHPSVPTILYGNSLNLLGVELCYTATATAYMTYIEINAPSHVSNGVGTQNLLYSDVTSRTDAACRYYALPAPLALDADRGVNIYLQLYFVDTASNFNVGKTTFVLQATGMTF